MIEVVAKLLRGPVFLTGEELECVITFTNPVTARSTSASSEMLAWASAQIHCQFHTSESRVALPPSEDAKYDVQAENETVFVPNRGERGKCILATNPKILFCDLCLDPGESKSYSYCETVPLDGPPSFRGQSVKYAYKLTVGCQRVNSPIKLLRVPFRVFVVYGLENYQFPPDEAMAPTNPFLDEDESTKKDTRLVDLATEMLMTSTSRRSLHLYNITNVRGKVGKFCIFKTIYKIGEDVLGTFDFSEGDIPCLQHPLYKDEEKVICCNCSALLPSFKMYPTMFDECGIEIDCVYLHDQLFYQQASGHDTCRQSMLFLQFRLLSLQFSVSLQTEEHVQEDYQRKPGQPVSLSTHARHQESCLHTAKTHFSLPVPLSATPSFMTTVVSLKWRLHFEFVTACEPVEPPTVLENQSEIITWTGAGKIDVDTFSWDLPIKVLPTNPVLASYVSQLTSFHSIAI